ncbi:MAG TPA: 3-phosphoglycerate dehydrogenase family protein [Candidatus Nitrosotenuis sp.]|nr:3-phosphoglycerate dehydrogenase family protein [Candidatus Nitrosotenuis sp.]
MHILLADKLHPRAVEEFNRLPAVRVSNRPDLGPDDLPAALGDVDILVVRSTRVTRQALEAAPGLGLVIRAGSGVNTIDVETASDRGIYVANCPGKNAAAVAELTVGLILALDRRIPDCVAELRAGRWNKKEFSKARGLKGRTVGVVGTGRIGQEVIRRLASFEVELLAWSRSLTEDRAQELGVERCSTLEELARRSDVVTVHLALNSQTRGLLDRNFFQAMKEGACFINTARAEVVDQEALLAAMDSRGIRVGSDVFANEPAGGSGTIEDALARHPNCYGTHHIGASTDQAEMDTGLEAVRIARAFLAGEPIPNCVNLRRTPGRHGLVVRHEDRVGVLAGVFQALRQAGLNVQEMENQVFDGCKAACARVLLDSPVPPAVVEEIARCEGVLHVTPTGLPEAVTL